METWMIIAIAAAVVAAVVMVTTLVMSSKHRQSAKQTTQLREGFGPEYAKAVGEQGRSGAEEDLLKRQQRADLIQVRPLSAIEVSRYTENWTATQAQFVDNPGAALTAADRMLAEIIAAAATPRPSSNRARTRSRSTIREPSRSTALRTRSCCGTSGTPFRRTTSVRP